MDEINDNNLDQQQEEIQPEDILNMNPFNAGIFNGVSNQTDYGPVLEIQAKILEQQDKNISFLFNEITKLKKKATVLTVFIVVCFLAFLLMVFKLWVR